jgi:hypothetical protein
LILPSHERPPVLPEPPADPARASLRRPGAPRKYRKFIEHASQKHGVDPAIIEAVMRVESAFRPHAVSRKGAQGLMQLMPDTAKRFGVKNSFDPEQNILGGTRYLKVLLGMFEGDIKLACAAYNAGEKAVQRFGGIPPYRETRDYVKKIWTLLTGSAPSPSIEPRKPEAKPEEVYYVWHDDKGILNISQFPPAEGKKYKIIRP